MVEQFQSLSSLQALVVVLITIGCAFYFRLTLVDLISRMMELINSPLDILLGMIGHSEVEVQALSGRQRTFNLAFMTLGCLLLATEFWNLREISTAKVGVRFLTMGSFRIDLGGLVAVSYIIITVGMGIIGLEMIGFRKLFAEMLGGVDEGHVEAKVKLGKSVVGALLILSLVFLAYKQGELGMIRYDALGERDEGGMVMEGFYFWMSFFTPLLASVFLVRFDVIFAMFLAVISVMIRTYQRLTCLLVLAFEGMLNVVASPMSKIGEVAEPTSGEGRRAMRILKPLEWDNAVFRDNMGKLNRRLGQGGSTPPQESWD